MPGFASVLGTAVIYDLAAYLVTVRRLPRQQVIVSVVFKYRNPATTSLDQRVPGSANRGDANAIDLNKGTISGHPSANIELVAPRPKNNGMITTRPDRTQNDCGSCGDDVRKTRSALRKTNESCYGSSVARGWQRDAVDYM